MPELPDLKAKLKVDFSDADAAVAKAKLLGAALQQELGSGRGSEIDRSMKTIGSSVDDAGRRVENAGKAILKFGDNGKIASLSLSSATARTKSDFQELETRTRSLAQSMDVDFRKGMSTVVQLGADGSAVLGDVSKQVTGAGTAASQAGFSFLGLGPAMLAVVGAGTAVLAVLSPLLAVVGAAAVILTSFAVGLAAAATVAGLALGAVGGLAAGIVVLTAATQGWTGVTQTVPAAQQAVANATNAHTAAVLALHQQETAYNATSTHTAAQTLALQQARQKVSDTTNALTKAQQDLTAAETGAHNPLQTLKDDAKAMADTLGQQAAPMAAQLLLWIDKLIPSVQTLGERMLTWFGERLPAIFTGASAVSAILFKHLDDLGTVLGRFLDGAGRQAPQLTHLFDLMLGVGVDAVNGLLTNLLRLSQWFLDRLPAFEPIIGQIFGGLGTTVQNLGQAFGRFVDWLIANWPNIVFALDQTWKHFQEGYALVKPLLDNFHQDMLELQPLFTFIEQHSGNLVPLLQALGVAFGGVIASMQALFVIGVVVVAAIVGIATVITGLVNGIKAQMPQAGAQFSALGTAAQQMGKDMGGIFAVVGAAFSVLGGAIHGIGMAAGAQFFALGSAGQSMWHDFLGPAFVGIGTAFSVLGTAIHNIGVAAGTQFSALGSAGQSMWHDFLAPAFSGIGAAFSVLGSAIQGIVTAASVQFSALGTAGHQMQIDLGNFFNAIGAAFHQLGINVAAEVRAGQAQFSALVTAGQNMQRDLGNVFSAIGSGASQMAGVVSTVFSDLGPSVQKGLHAVSQAFDAFAGKVNGALGPFSVHINPTGYASGGVVPGYAPGQDVVPALLSPGEGVLTPQAVRGLGGAGAIEALNQSGGLLGGLRGLGAAAVNNVAGLSSLIGSIGGQCVVAVEKWTGHFFPVAFASQMTKFINSASAAIGNIFVSTIPPFGHTGIVVGPNQVIDSNWGLDERVRIHALSDIPSIAGYISGYASFGGLSGAGQLVSGALGALIDIPGMIKGLLSPLTSAARGALNAIQPPIVRDLGNAILDQLASAITSAAISAAGALVGSQGSPTVGGSLGQWISQAIALTGVPASWAGPLATLIGRESSGNPNAINRTDINAILGHPSQGLMQLIPSNFAAFHVPGTSGSILDPIANIAAGIRYILSRYGDISRVQQANAALPPLGYASGGLVVPNHVYLVGERGPELFVSDQAGQIIPGQAGGSLGAQPSRGVEARLDEVISLLASIKGAPVANRRSAQLRWGT